MKLRWAIPLVAGCSSTTPNAATPAVSAPVPSGAETALHKDESRAPRQLTSKEVQLPGANGPAFLDYIAYERGNSRVWVPVGSTGSVDVFDVKSGTFQRIDGFKTEVREVNGKKRTYGPSAAAVGDGFVYVGNRATSEVCPVDVQTLKVGQCLKLATPTDGVAYVVSVKEVWVTTPKEQTLTVLDASKPGTVTLKTTVKTDGEPEGYAVDEARGLFFTNLEDKGPTVVIDVKTHKVKANWNASCGSDGPRGVAFDAAHDFVIVACTDHVQVLDAAHDGALLGKLEVGAGIDNIDFADGTIYAAAGKVAKLAVAKIDGKGQFTVVAAGATAEGARNAVADADGNVYVADSQGARLLVFASAPPK